MTETPERHPTYFESRNVYQRLADMLPLVDKLCFVAEHGEVVSVGRVVREALREMFRLREMGGRVCKGTHVVVPREPTRGMIERGLDTLCNQSHEDNAPAIGDALEYIDLVAVWRHMIEAAQEQS